MLNGKRLENLLIISTLLLTIIVLGLQHFALDRTLKIDPTTQFAKEVVDDRGINGRSTASLAIEDNKFILTCNIVKSDFAYPFCELSIALFSIDQPKGINLTNFDYVMIGARYLNRNTESIRFQLRSYNEHYSTLDKQDTWKYNVVEYWPEQNSFPTKIPLNSLQLANWWLIEQRIPIEYSESSFNNVMVLELATGNNISPGLYTLVIEHITLHGKYFTQIQVYSALLILWVSTAIMLLFWRIKQSRYNLSLAVKKADELKQLNELLNVETKSLKEKAQRDPLTGALNRSGVKPLFTKKLNTLSLIFVDIDYFKKINDNYGHNFGDLILKEFAKLVSENCRTTDFLARWGGEEFLLVCQIQIYQKQQA